MESIRPVLDKLLAVYGLEASPEVVLGLDSRPSHAFTLQTAVLSKILKALKKRAPSNRHATVEDCFMQLITKVRWWESLQRVRKRGIEVARVGT